ncbi:hypothetical protein QJV38_14045 [Listeria cossartiae subsp. cayugensis]|uniref:Uncharacterized protein n=1 Tax=Listeria cossartiae subsp. cayugensis TaxID=2713505 RepID=A0ABU2ISA3_9LIST|nr:hypothetical protein [Listeria cossartiae]MDT0067315.1 hypothetical protein [Listeria cossartiae subsp. cayugensis]MDT0081162.1 hypothetical protein [Listeria cossartiae subsp. cayugensis]MDT0083998.1 hypothetical protein [Listeria cossartiae subsp. cayugensis]MDT0089534.1 hypothetical protein [Listeria cossartiae subsp. cayugensis]MDT0100604.1 hypothetical protein [Listeria cossartiae subsp. cayugensis]
MTNKKEELSFEDRVILAAAEYMTREFSEEDDDLEEYMDSMVAHTKDYVEKGENIPIATGYVDEPYCELDAYIDVKNKSIFQVIDPFGDDECINLTFYEAETEEDFISFISDITLEEVAQADGDLVQEILDEKNAKNKGFSR